MSISLDNGLSLQIGDHSYIHDQKIRNPSGALTHVTIGKYCSIATDLTVIGYDHHTEWISTYPFLDDGNRVKWAGTNGIPCPQEERFGSNKSRGDIQIGNDVWIGYGVKLFKGVTVGNGAAIGACSLVNKSVEPYTIVAGIPARPIRKRFSDSEISLLQKIKWWNWPAEKINKHMNLLCSSRVSDLEKALEQEVRAVDCLARADAAYARADLKGACEALLEAVSCTPDSTELLTCLGNIQFQLTDYAGARESFLAASKVQPGDSDILVRLANAALRCQDQPLFERALEEALEADPRNPNAVRLLANQHFQHQRFAEAAEGFCAALVASPDDTNLLLHLGESLHELGDDHSARWCIERVLKIEPAHAVAQEGLSRLAEPRCDPASASRAFATA